jgi:WD40 repeat protein
LVYSCWIFFKQAVLMMKLKIMRCGAALRGHLGWLAIWAMHLLLPALPASAATVPTEPQLRIEAGMHSAPISRIATDGQGRYAVSASHDKTARVWEVATGRLLQTLRPPIGPGHTGKLNAVAITPDAKVVALSGFTGGAWNQENHVYLFARESGQLLRRLPGLPSAVGQLAFSPDGRWLAATLGGGNGVRVWDWQKNTPALADGVANSAAAYGDSSIGASWHTDNRLVTSSLDGKLRLYQVAPASLKKLHEVVAPDGKQPYGVAFAPDGRSLAVAYVTSLGVDVLDGHTLEIRFAAVTKGVANGNLSSVAWSADGQSLVAAGRWHRAGHFMVRRWAQQGRGPAQDTATTLNTVTGLATLPGGGWLLASAAWGVLSANGSWQARASAPQADLSGSLGQAFLLHQQAGKLQFGFESYGQAAHQFDLATRQLSPGSLPGGTAPRTEGIAISDWEDTPQPRLQGKALALEGVGMARSLAINPDATSFVLGTNHNLHHYRADGSELWHKPLEAPGEVWGVNIPPTGKVVVAAYGDGTIRWHRLQDGQELLAFFPHADRKRWVLWTPSGYYDASPGGEALIGWHVNRGMDQAADFFPAAQFRSQFNRPEVIDRVLETLDEAQAVAQADQAAKRRQQAIQIATALPPTLQLLSPAELRSSNTRITVRVRANTAADAPVSAWRVRLNGQALADVRGLGREGSKPTSDSERELSITIPEQNSQIELFAENRHGISTPATLQVTWTGEIPTFQIKPKLYVLAIGVGKYQHPSIDKLPLTSKDAQDFANVLRAQQGKLYREVNVKLLVDADATRDNIADGLEWLQQSVTQHDVGMLFFAGHAINDNALGYTFLPVNTDLQKLKRTGITVADIRTALAANRGKALFFFDTCHAGNVLTMPEAGKVTQRTVAADVNGVINELTSAQNGVVVFSSSTGRQLSFESATWGNGAFTKAVVEGLQGKANYQNTGRITYKMLDLYISERVKELTKGKQHPVTQAPNGVPDFPLVILGEGK